MPEAVYVGIMPIAGAWGIFWIKSRWARLALLVTFTWWIFLLHVGGEIDNFFIIAMVLPIAPWGFIMSKNKWWEKG